MLELEWPYKRHAGIFAGAQQYAEEQGWESTIDEYVTERLPARRTSRPLPYDGVIGRASEPLAQRAGRVGLPMVNTWIGSPVREQLPGVFADLAAMGQLRAQHLLARGLRRFAAFATGDYGSQLEVAAFRATVREAGFPCITANVPTALEIYAAWQKSEQRIDASMQQWQPPIGVFSTYEHTGRLVAQMCRQRGWRVPSDVAIVAGQNEETICERPRPSLTSIEVGFERIGYEAARLLDRLMDKKQKGKQGRRKKKNEPPEQILLPPAGLVVRESSDFFAVDDPEVAEALAFIAASSHRPLSPGDVAQALSIHPKALQRRFDKVLGRGIAEEIRRARIERAKRELTQTDLSITAIARNAGFGPRRQLTQVFVRELGMTPREYRQQRQLESER